MVTALVAGETETSDAVLMDIAGALLYIEATLMGMVGTPDDARNEQSLMPTTDVGQIHRIVIKEARTGLEHAKDGIIEFIASQWNHENLANVPHLLNQVRGGLVMIPLERAAALVETCRRYIEEQLLEKQAIPNWQNLDTLADAITSVEYYLERLAEDHASQGETILDVAEESLSSLGYAPLQLKHAADSSEAEETLAVEPTALQEPLTLAVEESLAQENDAAALSEQQDAPDSAESATAMTAEAEDIAADTPNADLEPLPSADEPLVASASLEETTDTIELGSADVEPLPIAEPEVLDAPLELEADAVLELEPRVTEVADAAEVALDEIPEVELAQAIAPQLESASANESISLDDVMSAPVSAINPPAVDVPPSILPPPADEEPTDEELQEVFVEEAEEVLETLNEFFPKWRANTDDKNALTEVRRAFHTLKGSGRMVRALVAGELAWSIENMLNRVIEGNLAVTEPVFEVIAAVIELFPELVAEYAAQQQRQRDDVDQLAATAHALARNEPVPVFSTAAAAEPVAEPAQASAMDVIELEPMPAESSAPEPVVDEEIILEPAFTAPVAESIHTSDEELLDPILLDIFKNEAQSHVQSLTEFLADCAQQLPNPISDDLQRAFHTLKGSAFMAGILPMATIATALEKLAKDYKANLLSVEFNEALLLSEAEQLLQVGIEQLDSTPLQDIEGAPAFLEKLYQIMSERLAHAEDQNADDPKGARDPKVISTFLAEGMDTLLDMDEQLECWRTHPAERKELATLLDELINLGQSAEVAELPQIEDLCSALLELYSAVKEERLPTEERFFTQAKQAHDALINMMDQVAAGLQVDARQDCVDALYELMSDELRPAAIVDVDSTGSDLETIELQAVTPESELESALELDLDLSIEPPHSAESLAETELPEHQLQPVLESTVQPTFAPVQPEIEDDFSTANLDQDIIDLFLEEGMDLLESASASLETWLADPDNKTAMPALLRDLHTLKGGARMAEIEPIGDLAHEIESLYEGLLDGRYTHSNALGDLLLRGHDRLAVLLDQLQAKQTMQQPRTLINSMLAFRRGETAPLIQTVNHDQADDLPPATLGVELEDLEPFTLDRATELSAEVIEDADNSSVEDEHSDATEAEDLFALDAMADSAAEVIAGNESEPASVADELVLEPVQDAPETAEPEPEPEPEPECARSGIDRRLS